MSSLIDSFEILASCLSINCKDEDVKALREKIVSGNIVWEQVISLANNNLLAPALWVAISEKGLAKNLPTELCEYLKELHSLNTTRNEMLRKQIIEAVQALNSIDNYPVLLKGSSYLFLDTFSDIGSRMMYDIDILVDKKELQSCIQVFKGLNYESDPKDEIKLKNHHHLPPLFRSGDYGAVELHGELLEKSAASILSTSEAWHDIEDVEIEDCTVSVLSPTHQVLHSMLHSQVVDRYHERHIVKLRALYDISYIVKHNNGNIDWIYIKNKMRSHGLISILYSYIYQAHVLLGCKLPPDIQPGIISKLYFFRCMAAIRWEVVDIIEHKLLRYSRYEICRRFKCEGDWLSVNVKRFQYSIFLLKRILNGAK